MEHETKEAAGKERSRLLKMWIEYDRMEALAAFLGLVFATVDYENNFEDLRASRFNVPYGSRTFITLTTLFTRSFR